MDCFMFPITLSTLNSGVQKENLRLKQTKFKILVAFFLFPFFLLNDRYPKIRMQLNLILFSQPSKCVVGK